MRFGWDFDSASLHMKPLLPCFQRFYWPRRGTHSISVILWCIQGQHIPVWAKAPHTLYKAVQFLWPGYSVFVSWMVLSATISHYCLPSKNRKSQMFRKEPLNASPFPLSQVQLTLNNVSWTVRVYLTHEFF